MNATGRMRRALAAIVLLLIPLLLWGCAKPVTLYTDMDKYAVRKLIKPFMDKSGISVYIVEFRGANMLADAIASLKNGEYVKTEQKGLYNYADVVFSSDIMMGEALSTRKMLLPFAPDAAASIPVGAKRDGWWYGVGGHAFVLMWNTDLVCGEGPQSLLDLADESLPEGSVALINPNYMLYYYSGACAKLGADTVVPFLQRMLDRSAHWLATPEETAAKVAGGSAYACLTSLRDALQAKADGAPVAWAAPDQEEGQMGAYVLYNTVCLAAVSTMPERGRQLADYLLSPEAEKYAAELGLSNVTLRDCGAGVPVVRPLETSLEESRKAMQEELNVILPYFTSANPKYTGK